MRRKTSWPRATDRRLSVPPPVLFVHHTAIVGGGYRSLAEGATVSFEAEAGEKGPKAVNVQLV